MSREILFKGKHIHATDSNEHLNETWVHGYLSDKDYIYDKSLDGEFLVDENTICQYTGLTDKNVVKHSRFSFKEEEIWIEKYLKKSLKMLKKKIQLPI